MWPGGALRAPTAELGRLRNGSIGYIFQAFRLFHSLTALENVALTLELGGAGGRMARTRAAEALVQVGLGSKLQLKPDKLSGGDDPDGVKGRVAK